MMRYLRKPLPKLIVLALLLTMVVVAHGGHAFAASQPFDGVSQVAATGFQVDVSPLPKVAANASKLQAIFSIVFSIVGAISLLMITIGGFRYITSDGDPQAAGKAKGTIIYALIGLVVSISAVAIVTFFLGKL